MKGVPRLRRSATSISASQPFRAGLTFGPRPYGPGSDLLFISRIHADSKARSSLGVYGTTKEAAEKVI
jgi:hypothetical protein